MHSNLRRVAVLALLAPSFGVADTGVVRKPEVYAMGVTVLLQVVDMQCYRDRFIPAIHAFRESADREPLVEMLRLAERNAVDAESPWDIESVKRNPEYIRRSQEAEKARKRGNLKPARELVAFVAELSERQAVPRLLTRRDVKQALSAIDRPGAKPDALEPDVVQGLMENLCLPWDRPFRPIQNISEGPLLPHLYAHSEVVEGFFQGDASGEELEVSTGESTVLFTREQVVRFAAELAAVPRPADIGWAQRDYDHLRAMVNFVLQHEQFALAFTLS